MSPTFSMDEALERIEAGAALTPAEVRELAETPDVLAAGMLADALRRARHGATTTYLRVATCAFDALIAPPAEASGGGELRLTGAPASLDAATAGLAVARTLAGARTLAALGWSDVLRYAPEAGGVEAVLGRLRRAGLDMLAEVALDDLDPAAVLGPLAASGFDGVRLHVARPGPAGERVELWHRVAAAQAAAGGVASVNPLPLVLSTFKPTTGYDDVKAVALARLALPAAVHVQVDWARYGPKLAQVALTFGADDVDNVSASDEAPLGRRRAPLEEIRRNIEAAGFQPAERQGRFITAA